MLVAFVNQVSNVDAFSEGEAVFSGELQHILHRLAPLLLLYTCGLIFGQRLESTRDNLLRRAKAPCAKLLLYQTLTLRIESNGHRTPVYPQECYGFGAAGFPNFAASIGTFPCTPVSSVVDCPLVHVSVQ